MVRIRWPAGENPGLGRCGACGPVSQTDTRAASGLPPGTLRSPARSWLTSRLICGLDEKAGPGAEGERRGGSAGRRAPYVIGRARLEKARKFGWTPLGAPPPLDLIEGEQARRRTPRRANNRGGGALAAEEFLDERFADDGLRDTAGRAFPLPSREREERARIAGVSRNPASPTRTSCEKIPANSIS